MPAVARPFDRFVRALDTVVALAGCCAAGAMTLTIVIEVIARYLFDSSMPFSNELARILFVWTVFLGLPLALSRGRHVAITLLDQVLPPAGARLALRAGCVASIVLLATVLYKSVELTARNWDQTLNTLPLSAGVFYLAIPVGIAVAIVFLAVMAWHAVRQIVPDEETDAEHPA